MKKIAILMSTYNGEKYIEEQLNSLYMQSIKDFDIYIRDDGSSDNTIKIIDSYQQRYGNINLDIGTKNLKPARSFMKIIMDIDDDYEYYAFCDQDDVWNRDKLERAITQIGNNNIPVLYCSNYQLVDADLNNLPDNGHHSSTDFYTSIIYSNATGCTIVFNRKLLKVLKLHYPQNVVMHDDWCHKVCLAIGGKVIYDNYKSLKYRQHGNNADGGVHGFVHKMKMLIGRFKHRNRIRSNQLKEIKDAFALYIEDEKITVIDKIYDSRKVKKLKKEILKDERFVIDDKKSEKHFKFAIKMGIY